MDWINKVIKSYLTAADGETYAIGRGLGIILFIFGLTAPSLGFLIIAVRDGLTMDGLAIFLNVMVPYLPSLVGAVTLLVWGTNPTEPKE